MIDEADTRRGRTTAHVAHGTKTAVLLGDYFYTHAFDLVAKLGDAWMTERLTHTTNIVCAGELHQMCARADADVDVAEYERIIYGKTAALTELSCLMGALRANDAQRDACGTFGRHCGMAFQIIDDCLDYSGDVSKVGKSLAVDAERGLMTLPLIYFLQDPAEKARWGTRLGSGDADQALRQAVRGSSALTRAQDEARRYVREAQAALQVLPANPAREQLMQLAEFIVSRDF